jgi:hypothetical protein
MPEDVPIIPISVEDYNLWRHHPVSKIFLKYLSDYADALEREGLERWRAGTIRLVDEQEMRGRVLTIREMSELQFEAISVFYGGERAENAT